MLKPKVKAREFERLGFKRCKGIPKESECYYLCIAKCDDLFCRGLDRAIEIVKRGGRDEE